MSTDIIPLRGERVFKPRVDMLFGLIDDARRDGMSLVELMKVGVRAIEAHQRNPKPDAGQSIVDAVGLIFFAAADLLGIPREDTAESV